MSNIRFIYALATCVYAGNALHAGSWAELLDGKRAIIDTGAYAIIHAQQQAYSDQDLPKIADPRIVAIPITGSDEKVISCAGSGNERLYMLPNPVSAFASPDCNSGFPSAPYVRQTVYEKLVVTLENLDALAPEFGYVPGQIHIKVFEGLRDIQTQSRLFNNKLQEIQQANPEMTEEAAYAETCKWVSPVKNNVPVHSTGAAVDIRLWDAHKNSFVDVGPFGVIWGANPIAPTFSESATTDQKLNRLYLLVAATHAGLVNYGYEHWHFSDGDRYATYWRGGKQALYGPAEL